MADQSNKPSVYIGLQDKYQESPLFSNICYGLEEEGIPYDYFLSDEDVNQIAFNSAQKSRLSVGIGLGDDDQIIIQHKKLDADQPFFQKKVEKYFQAKIMGSNAARLVKGIPIKEIPDKDDYYSLSDSDDNTNPITRNGENFSKTDTANNNESEKSSAENRADSNSNSSAAENSSVNSDSIEEITKLVLEALKNIENK